MEPPLARMHVLVDAFNVAILSDSEVFAQSVCILALCQPVSLLLLDGGSWKCERKRKGAARSRPFLRPAPGSCGVRPVSRTVRNGRRGGYMPKNRKKSAAVTSRPTNLGAPVRDMHTGHTPTRAPCQSRGETGGYWPSRRLWKIPDEQGAG